MNIGKGNWSISSEYYPYMLGDLVYYYNDNIFGTFMSNIDNNTVSPDDDVNGYLFDYPKCYWTYITNSHAENIQDSSINGIGKGKWSTESVSYPYSTDDIIFYENGGLYASFISLINNNITPPDDIINGYNGSDIYHWKLLYVVNFHI